MERRRKVMELSGRTVSVREITIGEALKDTAIVGAGESQYFKVMQVEA